ncbi:hypothetical protein DY000_02037699 [Brassica cretica]|uniref:RNase H type-1 domain-containing protein n=1 Tax=Brassica cretica TaxID=69181 RepID=A0ABQ7BRW6_BRACR|nr:hypothetical protein DY000_02037699 [Brassica cretica]
MKWNKSKVEALLPLMTKEIQLLNSGHPTTEDIHVWQPLQSGKYTTKSARNTLLFEKRTLTLEEIATKAIRLAGEWINAQPQKASTTQGISQSRRTHQIRTTEDVIPICKSDAAFDAQSKRAGLAWITREESGTTIIQGSKPQGSVNSPLVAEALALRAGIIDAVKLELSKLRMLSDNSTLIRAINNDAQVKEIFGIVKDIQELSSAFVEISFAYVPRSSNVEADRLAKLSLSASFVSNP